MDSFYGNGMGVYTAANQFDFNPDKLRKLGFIDAEIMCMQQVLNTFGKVTMQSLQQGANLNYEQAQRIMYMYNICTGRVQINSEDELVSHLRKMFGRSKRLTINDLPVSSIQDIPRTAMVAGIKEPAYSIWNSKNYPEVERAYKVVDVSSGYVTIETDRWPELKYKQPRKIQGVLEIKDIDKANHLLRVAIHKDYCKLCNRYVIVASTKKPEFYLGIVKIICIEGTRIYVYATNIGIKEHVHYTAGNSRVYSYGYYVKDIKPRLMSTASKIYQYVCGFTAFTSEGNQKFEYITKNQNIEAPDDGAELGEFNASGPVNSPDTRGDFSW